MPCLDGSIEFSSSTLKPRWARSITTSIDIRVQGPTSLISHGSEDVVVDHVADLRWKRQEGESRLSRLGDFESRCTSDGS